MEDITKIVAIDGPAGAGKSTVARLVAHALGFAFLDTGAMYRAATWHALHQGVDMDDAGALASATCSMPLEMHWGHDGQEVRVDNVDITNQIRSPEVTRAIYKLDQVPAVREHLVRIQRTYGAKSPTVAEGRDIGTVVFPKAKCKIFLDASLEERARRRAKDLAAKGITVDMAQLCKEIHERDEKNCNRSVSPLRKAHDAVAIDTSAMSIAEVVDRIVRLARARLG